MENPLSELKRLAAQVQQSNAEHDHRKQLQAAENAKYENAWNDAFEALNNLCIEQGRLRELHYNAGTLGSTDTMLEAMQNVELDVAPFITLAKLFKSLGYDAWLQEMLKNVSKDLMNREMPWRPSEVLCLTVLIEAGKPRITKKRLAAFFIENVKDCRSLLDSWGLVLHALDNLKEYFSYRIHEHNKKDALKPYVELVERVRKKPAHKRDIKFMEWQNSGMANSEIRDKWNTENQREPIGSKADGIDVVKKAIANMKLILEERNVSLERLKYLLETDPKHW